MKDTKIENITKTLFKMQLEILDMRDKIDDGIDMLRKQYELFEDAFDKLSKLQAQIEHVSVGWVKHERGE
jgi:flagellar capping protein FliD